jgi:Ribosomal protein L22p/L17e
MALIVVIWYAAAKAKGTHLRVHYKHCREIGNAIKGRSLLKAKSYLENVLLYKEAIPFTKYTGGIGRHSAAKQYKTPGDKVAWPQKATKTFLDLLTNLESNATVSRLHCFRQLDCVPCARDPTVLPHDVAAVFLFSSCVYVRSFPLS